MPRLKYDRPPKAFWNMVPKPASGCWEWQGAVLKSGYGRFYDSESGILFYAHRLAWILTRGPIDSSVLVCHTCDNRRCVRPSHMFLGNHKSNSEDMVTKGRQAYGSRNGQSKLNEQQVRQIRDLLFLGKKQYEIAEIFGVTRNLISYINTGKIWKHA